jgi:hypothetical protein
MHIMTNFPSMIVEQVHVEGGAVLAPAIAGSTTRAAGA